MHISGVPSVLLGLLDHVSLHLYLLSILMNLSTMEVLGVQNCIYYLMLVLQHFMFVVCCLCFFPSFSMIYMPRIALIKQNVLI